MKKTTVTQVKPQTYTAVRLSMVMMTALATVGTGVILAALLIRLVPFKENGATNSIAVGPSANSYVAGELLVKFAPGTSPLDRTKAVQAVLTTPVRVTTQVAKRVRSGLFMVTKMVDVVNQSTVQVSSMTPVLSPSVNLANVTNPNRQARGTSANVQASIDALHQWYVVKFSSVGVDLNQLIAVLGKQPKIARAELNRKVSAAATRAVNSTAAAASVKLVDAQKASQVLAGDANGDGKVDSKDLQVLVSYLTGGAKPANMAGADVNHNGVVDLTDLSSLVQALTSTVNVTPHDLTGDGKFNADDLNFLVAYLTGKGPAPSPLSTADVNGDGVVDLSDLSFLVNAYYKSIAANYLRGDVNADGTVDNRDVQALADYLTGKGPAPSPMASGDMNQNGMVDLSDLTMLVNITTNTVTQTSGNVAAASLGAGSSSSSLDAGGSPTVPAYVPPYIVGDVNADSRVNAKDITNLVKYLTGSGSAPSPMGRGDVNGDGKVDLSDLSVLVRDVSASLQSRLAAADVNGDGSVNVLDLIMLRDYLVGAKPTIDLAKADVTGDGVVDLSDLSVLGQYVSTLPVTSSCPASRTVGTTTFLNGDVNGDGVVDLSDLSQLVSQVYANGTAPTPADRSDVDCDGTVTALDVVVLTNLLTPSATSSVALPGDANGDGVVDTTDVVASGQSIASPHPAAGADINSDGRIDLSDTIALVHLLKLDTTTVRTLPDVDGNGTVDWSDASALMNAAVSGTTGVAIPDINGDGASNIADAIDYVTTLQHQQTTTEYLPGDVNADGLVDCTDAQALFNIQYAKAKAATPVARQDVNVDGQLNIVDPLLLAFRACPANGIAPANGVRIALLDSGLTLTSVLKSTIMPSNDTMTNKRDDDGNGYVDDVQGWNAFNNTPNIVDCNGHGSDLTQMLATKDGIAATAKVIPVKVLDCQGSGTVLSVTQGLAYAAIRGADIADLPFSGYGSSALLADIVSYAKTSGMVVIAAAGNDGVPTSRVLPANVSGVLSVNATATDGKTLTSYSNTGALVSAPGASAGVRYEGSSVSATYVTGTAALILTKYPALSVKQVESRLVPVQPTPNPKKPNLLNASVSLSQ